MVFVHALLVLILLSPVSAVAAQPALDSIPSVDTTDVRWLFVGERVHHPGVPVGPNAPRTPPPPPPPARVYLDTTSIAREGEYATARVLLVERTPHDAMGRPAEVAHMPVDRTVEEYEIRCPGGARTVVRRWEYRGAELKARYARERRPERYRPRPDQLGYGAMAQALPRLICTRAGFPPAADDAGL